MCQSYSLAASEAWLESNGGPWQSRVTSVIYEYR
jgi:hypothetical protein